MPNTQIQADSPDFIWISILILSGFPIFVPISLNLSGNSRILSGLPQFVTDFPNFIRICQILFGFPGFLSYNRNMLHVLFLQLIITKITLNGSVLEMLVRKGLDLFILYILYSIAGESQYIACVRLGPLGFPASATFSDTRPSFPQPRHITSESEKPGQPFQPAFFCLTPRISEHGPTLRIGSSKNSKSEFSYNTRARQCSAIQYRSVYIRGEGLIYPPNKFLNPTFLTFWGKFFLKIKKKILSNFLGGKFNPVCCGLSRLDQ